MSKLKEWFKEKIKLIKNINRLLYFYNSESLNNKMLNIKGIDERILFKAIRVLFHLKKQPDIYATRNHSIQFEYEESYKYLEFEISEKQLGIYSEHNNYTIVDFEINFNIPCWKVDTNCMYAIMNNEIKRYNCLEEK